MDTAYLVMRWCTLIISTTAFWLYLWKGARHWTLANGGYNWPMALLGLWAFTSAYGTAEALALNAHPGPRVPLAFVTATWTFWFAVKTKIPSKKLPNPTEAP